mgnify:CR=1 FL=1
MKKLLTISLLCLFWFQVLEAAKPYREGDLNPLVAGSTGYLSYCFPEMKDGSLVVLLDNGLAVERLKISLVNGEAGIELPFEFSTKAGLLKLRFFNNGQSMYRDELEILPDKQKTKKIESFCGPKHLVVGRNDFSMIVSTVLDIYDNPLPEGTPIGVNFQQGGQVTSHSFRSETLYGYKKYYAGEKSGYGAITTFYDTLGSESFRLDIYATDPEDFEITYERQHAYADGEQLVVFSTSIIKDGFGNVISDGTVVQFVLEQPDGPSTIFNGVTIAGIARGLRYAPQAQASWKVRALIPNYAISTNQLAISFRQSVKDFDLSLQRETNRLNVGPVTGFMGQWVKDGTDVTVRITNAGTSKVYEAVTTDGRLSFPIDFEALGKRKPDITVTIAGITKTIKTN